jgi:hypothetical protein
MPSTTGRNGLFGMFSTHMRSLRDQRLRFWFNQMFNKSSLIELPGAARHQIWVENRIISKGAVPSGTELFQVQI